MGKREERERLLRALYSIDILGDYGESSVRQFAEKNGWDQITVDKLLAIAAKRVTIDESIAQNLKGWTVPRIAVVDRSVLRLAVYELAYEQQTPMKVVISEAIEMAKKYGAKDSFQFVNAVLDAIARQIGRSV